MAHGFRIKRSWDRVGADLIAAFRELPVANVSDSMSRLAAFGPELRPMHASGMLAGPALTVRSRPGDNLMLHKAIDMAEPGDVIVMDAGGDTTNSLMGELMLAHAMKRGVAGVVLYGAIRDAEAIRQRNLPFYACGITHRGPYKNGPGEIGLPISLGGTVIEPGDLILGDFDGVVAVPKGEAGSILSAARNKQAAETKQMEETEAGTLNRAWVDKTLEAAGCVYLD